MRDSNRIPRVLGKIEKIWTKYPDFRLNQLIYNITAISNPLEPFDIGHYTLYNFEDEDFEYNLDLYIKNNL